MPKKIKVNIFADMKEALRRARPPKSPWSPKGPL